MEGDPLMLRVIRAIRVIWVRALFTAVVVAGKGGKRWWIGYVGFR